MWSLGDIAHLCGPQERLRAHLDFRVRFAPNIAQTELVEEAGSALAARALAPWPATAHSYIISVSLKLFLRYV